MQAASFNYDMLYKIARAISDEVRAKVKELNATQSTRQCHGYWPRLLIKIFVLLAIIFLIV